MTNLAAFLLTITFSELGQDLIDGSDQGFNVLVGSTPSHIVTFPSYADHPRISVPIGRLGIESTAAGAFQILAHNYDFYKEEMELPDFGPDSQRRIATRLISERNALHLIAAGEFDAAVLRCNNEWASLPGSTYGQHTNNLNELRAYYLSKGGILSPATSGAANVVG